MKLMYFDFECSAGHVFEELVQPDVKTLECHCKAQATRLVSAGHIDVLRMGVDPDFTTVGDRWANLQEQKARKDKGSMRDGAPNLSHY